jgi:hypothetical protein
MSNDVNKRYEPEVHESFEALLTEGSLTDGQRRRLGLFRTVESGVCTRVEQLCVTSGVEVTDVAVLVVAAEAHDLLFTADEPSGTCVLIGHRDKVYAYLRSVLPPADDAPFDPYEDLLEPAPPRCVRVLIVDRESLTVMSYGTFVTVRLGEADMPEA